MAVFAWEGRTRTGEVRKGTMEAEAEPDVASRLRAQGITLSKAKRKAKDIEIKVVKIKRCGNILKFACTAEVDGARAAEAEVSAMVVANETA